MVAGLKGDTPEVGGRFLNITCDTYANTTTLLNGKYTLSCHGTRHSKIVANGAKVPHLSFFLSWVLFVCWFVCWNRTRKTTMILRLLCWEENKPLGVITHGQRHKPRVHKRQRHIPRTCQSMANTLRFDDPNDWTKHLGAADLFCFVYYKEQPRNHEGKGPFPEKSRTH